MKDKRRTENRPLSFLDVSLLRIENGEDPKTTGKRFVGEDGRRYRIPIHEIYQTEALRYTGQNPCSGEALLFALDDYLNLIRSDPQTLFAYMEHIDEHTSVERTTAARQDALLHRIQLMKEEYLAGRIDEHTYELLCNRIHEQIKS